MKEINDAKVIFDELSEINKYIKYRELDQVKDFFEERKIQVECDQECLYEKH